MKKLIVGIASYEDLKNRSLEIAKGNYQPKRGEPKVWFTSIESFAKVLSKKNIELLNIISEHQPKSITALSDLSGRKKASLSITLKTMQLHGLILLVTQARQLIVPHVIYTDVTFQLQIQSS